ncbi:MAG TPA: DUF6171 family protein [Roseimicrobium sp.]|nr:DUF6171 family protein [Roseimicrobium sp.]
MIETDCKGCERSAAARLAPGEVQRLLAQYLASHPAERVVEQSTYEARLATCAACPDLTFAGTTCRHCGCLVAVRAKLADKCCPASRPRWL